MLTVNLLPEHARKITLSPIEQFHRTPLLWILVGLMALLVAAPLIPIAISGQQLRGLTASLQTLEPRRQQVEQLRRVIAELRAQEAALQRVRTGQELWSKRLNILSDVTPDGVWLTELLLDPANGLTIHGSAIGRGGSELASIRQLVKDLQADADFAAVVQDIQIESIKRVQEKEIEVVQFALACALRQQGEAPAP
jgi:Tfp pilus assembly protein PilN